MWARPLRRTFEYVNHFERHTMHGSLALHMILATETDRNRRAAAARAREASLLGRPFTAIRARLSTRRAAAHGSPSRAAPGTDSPSLGRPAAASLRGR